MAPGLSGPKICLKGARVARGERLWKEQVVALRRPAIASGLGILLILISAEIGLRIVGLNYVESRVPSASTVQTTGTPSSSNDRSRADTSGQQVASSSATPSRTPKASLQGAEGLRILMIGNSHTEGAGVQKLEAYPHQLEIRLRREIQAGRLKLPQGFNTIHVVNGGRGNVTTSQQRIKLLKGELHRDWLTPHIVIAVGGEPNTWNPVGLSLARRRMGLASSNDVAEWLSENLRVYRFVQLLRHRWHEERQKEMLPLRRAIEIINRFRLIDDMSPTEVEAYREKFRRVSRPRARVIYDAWSNLCLEADLDLSCILEVSRDFMQDHPSRFSIMIFNALQLGQSRTLQDPNPAAYVQVREVLSRLTERWVALGWKVELEKIRDWSLHRRYPKVEREEDLEILFATFDVHPGNRVNTNYLIESLGELEKPERQLNAIAQSLEEVPFVAHQEPLRRLRELADASSPDSIRDLAQHIYDAYLAKYPEDAQYELQVTPAELTDWIRMDFELLTSDLKKRGVPTYFHSYHWLRGIPMAEVIETALLSIRNSPRPTFNLGESFKTIVRSQPQELESYFVQSFGPNDAHPSPKGHGLIADLLLPWVSELIRDFPPPGYSTTGEVRVGDH